jgi:prolipoprotein diacylglyceryltransferase
MFVLLVTIYRKVTPSFATKIIPGVFLVIMFTTRFFLEYTKTRQATYTTDLPFTTGQMLSVPYIIVGILWIIWAFTSESKDTKDDKASLN